MLAQIAWGWSAPALLQNPFAVTNYSLYPFWNLGKLVAGYPGFDWKGAFTTGFRELKTDANC